MMTDKPPPYPDPQQPYPPQQPGYPQQHVGYPQQPVGYPQQPVGYPQQGVGYPQQPGYPVTTTTVVQQPTTVVIAPTAFHEVPVSMCCPTCKATIVTATENVAGTLTWLACFGLCIIGCSAGCCLIPFCLDSMKDVLHTCPNCHSQVGVFRRM